MHREHTRPGLTLTGRVVCISFEAERPGNARPFHCGLSLPQHTRSMPAEFPRTVHIDNGSPEAGSVGNSQIHRYYLLELCASQGSQLMCGGLRRLAAV